MRFDAFIGGSYESQAVTADQEKTINWYPEALQSPGATAKTALYPTPGVEAISARLSGNGRAHYALAGREFAVVGTNLIEIRRDGGTATLGTVSPGNDPATICGNGDLGLQLFITSGGNGYIYDLQLEALTQIAALAGRATMGEYLDGYFIALDANTSTIYISALTDGTSWTTGTDFAQRSLAPDPWKAMKVVGRYLWLFGEQTTEVWQDTGATSFPFAPFPSTLLMFGIAAPFSACVLGNDAVWLGRSVTGRTCVLRATGVTPAIISNYPLESAFEKYVNVSEAIGFTYSDHGHSFYILSFDKDNITWAYDGETQVWCERGTWLSDLNRFSSWRPRFYAFAFGEHRILDSSSGYIYRMSTELTTDVDGLAIRRVRRAPAIMDENKRVFYSSLELDLEPGLGLTAENASFTMTGTDLAISFTYVWTAPLDIPRITIDSTVVGGTGPFTYLWSRWTSTTGSESSPTATKTTVDPFFVGGGGTDDIFIKGVVTDTATGLTAQVGPTNCGNIT